jgi:hypothetical protein
MEIRMEYEIFVEQLKEMSRGRQDAITGQPYSPHSQLQRNSDELDYEFYISGWTNAICENSKWRKFAYSIIWRLEHKILKIGHGRCGLKIKLSNQGQHE